VIIKTHKITKGKLKLQLFIQTFRYNGNLITEQGTGEQNQLFQLAMDTVLTSQIGKIPTPHSHQLQLSHSRGR